MSGNKISANALETAGLYLLPMVFLFLFCLYPLLLMARYGITDDNGRLTLRYLSEVIHDRIFREVIIFTLVQAFVSALVTVLLAIPGAYLLARYSFPGRSVIMAATTVPFVLPSLVLAVGFLGLFGAQGLLNGLIYDVNSFLGTGIPELELLYTGRIIVLAHVFFNFPIALRILNSRFSNLDASLENAARSMGAGRVRTFLFVTLPQMKYSLISSFSLVFTYCMLSLGVILVIGGLNHTLEVELFSLFNDLKVHQGSALFIIGSLLVMLATGIYLWSSTREGGGSDVSLGEGVARKGGRRPGAFTFFLILIYLAMVVIVIFGPLMVVIRESLLSGSGGDITFSWYREVISRQVDPVLSISPLNAILNSLLFGSLTMLISVPLAWMTAHLMLRSRFIGKGLLDLMLLFPLGASSVALGYGLVKAYSGGPVELAGTWYLVVLVHSVIAYPLGARAIYSSLKAVPGDLMKAARSIGAGPLEAYFKVKLPLILPGILIASVFSFAISLGELGATLMVSREAYITMPVFLYRVIEGGGRQIGPMNAFAVILMAITFLSFLGIEAVKHLFTRWGVER
ncbi:MAG: iron ABC transporter permease [Candidatus Thermoplasmatota archaeon]|nr:iron ABC transporter permease [Candidatus Thermoplasmatota archaeon]